MLRGQEFAPCRSTVMKNTKIQWCHSTVNPVMGCDGCELWPGRGPLLAEVIQQLSGSGGWPADRCRSQVRSVLHGLSLSQIYSRRQELGAQIVGENSGGAFEGVVDAIRRKAKCYAGLLATMRAGHAGYADQFEVPKLFPDRVAAAARWGLPTDQEIAAKPWLAGLPRMIFLSDIGDALSRNVPFEYLKMELIDNVSSENGWRHIWLWLTKRPARMAEFGAWLLELGVTWPDNLMAMTTVTAQSRSSRVEDLRKVPAKHKGLSLEPLFGPADLNWKALTGLLSAAAATCSPNRFTWNGRWSCETDAAVQEQRFSSNSWAEKLFSKTVPMRSLMNMVVIGASGHRSGACAKCRRHSVNRNIKSARINN
jgi:protein gp37